MATSAPKSAPKTGPKPVASPEAAPVVEIPVPARSKKKIILLIAITLIMLSGGGYAEWYFIHRQTQNAPNAPPPPPPPPKAPVFVLMEPFTVNLQSEGGEQFLQTTFTLQVADRAQEELIKSFMPQVRSRLLLLLSSKKASEISNVTGKKKLSEEIIATVNQPFTPKGPSQAVTDVFFTSFVIQ